MSLYIENAKKSTKMQLNNEIKLKKKNPMSTAMLQDTRSICKNSTAFLYTANEKSKNGIKKIILFTTASKRIKYLGINLMKKYKTYTLIPTKFN